MPKGTRAERCYKDLTKKKGYGKGKAAAICQISTKQSLATGKSLKKKRTVKRKK